VNTEHYKERLLDLEKDLSARAQRQAATAREQTPDTPGDSGDASVADQVASEGFTEAQLNSDVLKQVREALKRVDDGSYGKCIVDGALIEEKRLEAMPWTPYCLKHQAVRDAKADRTLPTM
jgi:DnaK suppressor protein